MSCAPILSQLSLYAGDDLDLRAAATVEAHLQRCLSCYREYQRQAELLERVRRASQDSLSRLPALGDAFTASVMGQIDGPPPLPRLVPRLVMASGWAAALFLCALLAWNQLPFGKTPWSGDAPDEVPGPGASAPVTALELGPDLLGLPDGARPLQLVPDEERESEDLGFDDIERLLLGPRLESIPVSYPMRQLKDY